MQVYPAAALVQYAPERAQIYFVDPNPSMGSTNGMKVYAEKATSGVPKVVAELIQNG
jgi:NAD-dependent deacetylase